MATRGLLPLLASRLATKSGAVTPASKRASVAILLRSTTAHHQLSEQSSRPPSRDVPANASAELSRFLSSPTALQSTIDSTEILFIKRAASPSDPWSGQVAYPGGRRSIEDADDLATAVRETREEIGIDLLADFLYLGRLDDRPVYARGRRHDDFALCPFVFVQRREITPRMTLQTAEVQAVRWVRMSLLRAEAVDPFAIAMPFGLVPVIAALPAPLKRLLGVDTAHYPSLLLLSHQSVLHKDASISAASGTQRPAALALQVAAELAQSGPPPSYDSLDDPSQKFRLWGLTMQATSDLLRLAGLPPLNWPPIRFRSALANSFVYALCGYIEGWEWLHGRRGAQQVSAKHVVWAAAATASPLVALAVALTWLT